MSVAPVTISEQKQVGQQLFPFVLSPEKKAESAAMTSSSAACEWVRNQKSAIDAQLLEHGAILFRGFPLDDAQAFDDFVTSFGYEQMPYVGGAAPRKQVTKQVFTANEAPPDQPIPFHHEMAQVPSFPSVLFFYCEVAPPSGGQTPLVLSHHVYTAMAHKHPRFVQELEEKKVRYTRVLPDQDDPSSPIGRGWRSTFQTQDRAEAERKLTEQGTTFEWTADGGLKTVTALLPAIREDPRTGKKMWFNSIIAAYKGWRDCRNCPERAVTFGDGSPMPPDVMDDLDLTLDQLAADVTWQHGDVFMVDNRQVLHARRPFTPPRRILAALAK
ncbi:clavaminate synthase-like protein At3g21360 [Aplysia californica]|uniref:Clavaminate synthase-like protein At3g21360 n=1 Tax=Aplysia californica TaxID=6500 RepID=A0ABM1AD73_APLCA|nr:clavaminate synthase-like protein At3g21360 [Aplysia californica]